MLPCANFMKGRISAHTQRGPNTWQEKFWQALLLFAEHEKRSLEGHPANIYLFICLPGFSAHTWPNLEGLEPCTGWNKPHCRVSMAEGTNMH